MDRFPDSLIAFQRMFPDDEACAAWLAAGRWPEGFSAARPVVTTAPGGWRPSRGPSNAPAAIVRPR